jgi:hypothetical protein
VAKRLLAVVLTLAVLAGIGYGVWWYFVKEEPAATTTARNCPTSASSAKPTAQPAVKPVPPRRVGVNVYNATDRQGLAASAATQLRARGFVVRRVANDPLNQTVEGVAEVRYGPKGGPYALTVMAQVEGAVEVLDRRADSSVDLVLGSGYRGLRPPGAAAAALTPKPTVTPRPTGC